MADKKELDGMLEKLASLIAGTSTEKKSTIIEHIIQEVDEKYSENNKYTEVSVTMNGVSKFKETGHFTITGMMNGKKNGIDVNCLCAGFSNKDDVAKMITNMFIYVMNDLGTPQTLAESMIELNKEARKLMLKLMKEEDGEDE